ncbi:hypothetical protein [Chitinophaga nivalis]|uniref:Uncharacterized protein n=1 Tax=Chitinophaga nivalis TaxID=2991709 RepID=A0ABT3IFJ1_9BACT|nr:hypothetical protein [Chitinophaga nivalis]MCW3467632.1 hypothetical protein [Chitinophaga nivalis]MCW3482676.1 hypothetical protein [Chitinophaga nivalis]
MNSLFVQLFQAMETRIKTAVPAIKDVAPESGQLEYSKEIATGWPVVYLDFTNFVFEDLAAGVQTATGEVHCRFIYRTVNAEGNWELDKPTVLSYYEAEAQLQQALQGWSIPGIAPLTRTKITTEKRTDYYWVRVITFQLSYEESFLPAMQQTTRPAMVLDGSRGH